MGLDSFKSDSENDEENETSTETKESGLESFKTDSKDSTDDDENERPKSNPWMGDFTSTEWNSMSTKEKVKYVRENYYAGYRPDVKLEGKWGYRQVIELVCECDNTFTFRSSGVCIDCGRAYKVEGGSVVKKHDPHKE